ncbi:MAG: hypothetical protein GDA38_21775 [Hormoscilla sp. SP12CHS1]|nr:hypothetical protein [Hormoscilla sp. SP12CHS1]
MARSSHHQNKHRDRSSWSPVDATFPHSTTTQLAPVLLHEFKAIAPP